MRYIMLVYETSADIDRRDEPAGDSYIAAWRAYHKALVEADVFGRRGASEACGDGHDGAPEGGQAAGAGRSVRRSQGGTGRVLHCRIAVTGRGPRVGRALPRGRRRRPGGSPVDVDMYETVVRP